MPPHFGGGDPNAAPRRARVPSLSPPVLRPRLESETKGALAERRVGMGRQKPRRDHLPRRSRLRSPSRTRHSRRGGDAPGVRGSIRRVRAAPSAVGEAPAGRGQTVSARQRRAPFRGGGGFQPRPHDLLPRARTGVSPTLPWNVLGCVGAGEGPSRPDPATNPLRLAPSDRLRTGTDQGNPTV